MRKFLTVVISVLLAIAVPDARAAHDEGVAGSCEGYAPQDFHCVFEFTAERAVTGIGSVIGWRLGVLRGTISDGEDAFEITCWNAVAPSGCSASAPGEGFPAGSHVTIEVYALGAGGDGFWRVVAYYETQS